MAIVVLGALWHYVLKRPLYQHLYGRPDSIPLSVYDLDQITDIPEQPEQIVRVGDKTIQVQLIKKIETTAKLIYIDRYTKLGTWYRSHDGAKLYDSVVPLDLSWATGRTARETNCFEFSHGYRVLQTLPKCSYTSKIEKSNNHTIPANARIQKGLDILKAGDIAHIEGYLVYWQGTGIYSYYRFESAIQLGQNYPYLYGGRNDATLCRQLFLTKLTFDGYTFE